MKRADFYTDLLNPDQKSILSAAESFKSYGCMFQYLEENEFNGREIIVNGKPLIYFGSCSYMGFETNPVLINSSLEALKRFGTQTPSSRAGLSSPLYAELEDLLSQIFPGYQVVTQTVTLGHLSVLPLLIQAKDAIILDVYAHNSIRMACQLCRANDTFIVLAKHNDMDHVRYLTKRLKKDGYRNIWYCADSLYSMHGDYIDIHGLWDLLNEEEHFFAYVDDAHGTGWYGEKGKGYVFENIELHPRLIVIESMAKALAASGGVVIVQNKHLSEIIRKIGQTMIFSGPIQPPTLGAAIGALKIMLSDEYKIMQNNLKDLIRYFRKKCFEYDLPVVTQTESTIQLLRIGEVDKVLKTMQKLIDKGFYTLSAVYPAVRMENSGIRITITNHLKKKDIESLLKCIKSII